MSYKESCCVFPNNKLSVLKIEGEDEVLFSIIERCAETGVSKELNLWLKDTQVRNIINSLELFVSKGP